MWLHLKDNAIIVILNVKLAFQLLVAVNALLAILIWILLLIVEESIMECVSMHVLLLNVFYFLEI